jgi:carboxylesterase
MTESLNTHLKNPHLPGGPFLFDGNQVGIMMLHGFTATTAEVRPLSHILHGHGFTVAGGLLPGHGTQPSDLNKVSWRDWVREAEQLYLELRENYETVIIGGESTGGLVCLRVAEMYPEITAVLTYAPALKINSSAMDRMFLFLASPFIPFINKQPSDDDLAWQGYTVNPLKGVNQLLKLQRVVRQDLHKIHQPVLIVHGKLDETIHHSVPEFIYQHISSTHKEVHWMEKSSHCVILDQELEQVAKITLDFIDSVLIKE